MRAARSRSPRKGSPRPRPNAASVRRFLVVCLVLCFGLPLLAAAPLPSFFTKPSVIVFPFSSTGSSLDREASSRIATIIATQMANTGKVVVVPPPPGTERKDYLSVSRAHSAEYYISGYISALGDGASMVAQVVSTTTGIVIFSTTTQLTTYADAASQGEGLAGYISAHANRGLVAIGTAPPAAPPTPQPQASQEAAQANLTKLFGRKKKPAANPSAAPATAVPVAANSGTRVATATTAAPVPAVTAPAAALRNVTPQPAATVPAASGAEHYAVVPVDGNADAAARELATERLLVRTHGERTTNGAAACAAHNVRAVLNGTLTVRPDNAFGGHSATFDLHVSDCAGRSVFHHAYSGDAGGTASAQLATERAVEAAVGAFLNPPKRR